MNLDRVAGTVAQLSVLVAVMAWASVGMAQTAETEGGTVPELVTDRPDFTESSSAVPRSHLQFELGTRVATSEGPTRVAPADVLARYGVARHLELRVGTTPVIAEFPESGGSSVSGLGDATLGAKLAAPVAEGLSVGIIPWGSVSEPTREAAYSSGAISTIALEGGGPVSFGANVGAGYTFGEGPDSGLEGSVSFAAGFELPARFGAFVETYGIVPPGDTMDLFADGGLTYRVTPTLQLDGFVAVGVPELESISGGLGVSFLL